MVKIRKIIEGQGHAEQEELIKHVWKIYRNKINLPRTLNLCHIEKYLNTPISSDHYQESENNGDCFFGITFIFYRFKEFT